MPPESRLTRGLERIAANADVDVQRSFVAVSRIAHKKQIVRRSMFLAAVIVMLAGATAGGLVVASNFRAHDAGGAVNPIAPLPSAEASGLGHEAYGRIAGTYVTTVPRTGGVVSTYKLAGRWMMTLNRDGSVTFAAPFGYIRRAGPPELTSYSLAGSTLVTTALTHPAFGCDSSGVYRWTLTRGTLRFATLKDDCPYRPAVFASAPWQRR